MEDMEHTSGDSNFDNSITLEWNEDKGANLEKRVLIGKLMTAKILNRNTVRNMIQKGWNVTKGFTITEINQNVFLFSFDREEDCARLIVRDTHG